MTFINSMLYNTQHNNNKHNCIIKLSIMTLGIITFSIIEPSTITFSIIEPSTITFSIIEPSTITFSVMTDSIVLPIIMTHTRMTLRMTYDIKANSRLSGN